MNSDGLDYYLEGSQMILHTGGAVCTTPWDLASSQMFEVIVDMYVEHLKESNSSLVDILRLEPWGNSRRANFIGLLRALTDNSLEMIVKILVNHEGNVYHKDSLLEFVEGLYDFWRKFDRFLICHSEDGRFGHDHRPYRTFNMTIERITHLVRGLYRDICENITGDHPRVYRQVSAGFDVGVIAVDKQWKYPLGYEDVFQDIPFIRQVLINPPLLIDPPMNKRTGQFKKVTDNPIAGITIDKQRWLCYPAKVGPVVVFVYFHQHFIGLGCSLSNLFEIASDDEIMNGPDAVYFFGAPPDALSKFGELPTVFYDDADNNILVAAVPLDDFYGYFGYLKKMILTLHNIVMMKRDRLPFHGAMAAITLKNGASATILIIGDTAAGKSETLEAFRIMSRDNIRDIRIIADDMGSLTIGPDGRLIGCGTEIGAFVRLDDLEHGYAFAHVDRAIIMSPHKTNARVVLPVTTLTEVLRGYPVDFLLYANNYEEAGEEHPIIEEFTDVESALAVFREGKAMSKGTTTSSGLVQSYFANIFGPSQYRDMHEIIAQKTFEAASQSGCFIGQVKTRLGINGYENKGPQEAANALFAMISNKRTKAPQSISNGV